MIKIFIDMNLKDFIAWSGGNDTLKRVMEAGLVEELESIIIDLHPEGIYETELNDLLWFESDWLYETLGMESEEEL